MQTSLRTIRELDCTGKRVLMRVDFNVPLADSRIADDTRIRSALESIQYLLDKKCKYLVLMSHLGRPKGKTAPELSLRLVAERLSELLGRTVHFIPDCVGTEVQQCLLNMEDGAIALLENLRFHCEETANDVEFSRQLAKHADVFVNDAFGAAHRAHASTVGVGNYLPSYAGFLIEKEVQFLGRILSRPQKPFLAIVGGAKISSKISVLKQLLTVSDSIIIGGGMAYTLMAVQDIAVGESLLEREYFDVAKDFLNQAEREHVEILLPVDHGVGVEFSADTARKDLVGEIPDGFIAMDVGEQSVQQYIKHVQKAKTIFWNGPLGVFEFKAFRMGTERLAHAIADASALTIVGGGDSVAAIQLFGLAEKIDHVSTGGGASLEFLEGKTLPGISPLQLAQNK